MKRRDFITEREGERAEVERERRAGRRRRRRRRRRSGRGNAARGGTVVERLALLSFGGWLLMGGPRSLYAEFSLFILFQKPQ